jgi:HK97 family phage prohead protease
VSGTEYGLPFEIETKRLDGDQWTVEGYASTFGNTDLGGDIVAKGAFASHIAAGAKTRFLYSHDPAQVLGTATRLSEDDSGLYGSFRISKTPLGESVRTLLKDGALDSFSIGYIPRDFDFDQKAGTRTLKDVELLEVSVVAMPMNPAAVVTAVKGTDYALLPLDELLTTYALHRSAALEQAKAVAQRRLSEGRKLSDTTLAVLERLRALSEEDAAALLALATSPPAARAAGAQEAPPAAVETAGSLEAHLRRARLRGLRLKLGLPPLPPEPGEGAAQAP